MNKLRRMLIFLALAASVLVVLPISAQPLYNAAIGIYSVAACTDSASVSVAGTTPYANNYIEATIFYRDDDGDYVSLKKITTSAFTTGAFHQALVMSYNKTVDAGTAMRLDVHLWRSSPGGYIEIANHSQYFNASDCRGASSCSITIDTRDRAPADGTITVRSHYGEWFRPEGWLHGAAAVRRGRHARVTFYGVPCNIAARAWYYPKTGNTTPKLLPSQFWPESEFPVNDLDGTHPYVTTFANGIPATAPVEEDDPFVAR